MQGFVFNTPFYTKTDWHSGKLILSRNGQTKGFGEPGTMKFDRRLTFGIAAHEAAEQARSQGITGTTTYKGKRVSRFNMLVADSDMAHQSFGGAEKKAEEAEMKIRITGQELQNLRPMLRFGYSGKAFGKANPVGMR